MFVSLLLVSFLLQLGGKAPAWETEDGWNDASEERYSHFVEMLFAGDEDQDSWPNLQTLLRDPQRNVLFNRLGQNEDERLSLRPDCGDLAYVLRAYFAWKRGLPFRYTRCTRASSPECHVAGDNSMPRLELGTDDDVTAFSRFVTRNIMTTVHSSSGRTLPGAEVTDFYPVPIERDALRPGSVYVDPYGHALVLAGWIPQPEEGQGYILLVDAQPDGTIGRRRFWRGSPLFETDETYGGAGFKAFRPLDENGDALGNGELRGADRVVPLSEDQYQMTREQFYDRVEALASPRPLDTKGTLLSLLDSLEAQIHRRVEAVERGEQFMRKRRQPIDMPVGDLFTAAGEWEAYATPIRDWRLLIAFDVVVDFPGAVTRNPGRFRNASNRLEILLEEELERRKFVYNGSDGQHVELTLKELIGRSSALEMAYNPNDCVEIRWGEPKPVGPSFRFAPPEQRERMERFRRWFRERKRPPY